MSPHTDRAPAGAWVFAAFLGAYLVIWLWTYPRTFGIDDEANLLSLSLAMSRGTVFLDGAGIELDADIEWRGRSISKYSPFHAALLMPAIVTDWRGSFLVAPLFVVIGAFIIRQMLREHQLSDAWAALYFLDPGLLYYSRTLLAAVPAAVLGLAGASMLLRRRPRPCLAGLLLGGAVLLHLWMAPLIAVVAAVWFIERGRHDWPASGALAAGALPPALALGLYNFLTTGHPLMTGYWLTNHQAAFDGRHLESFLGFYLLSLVCVPLGGWAVFTRRWSGTWAVPAAALAIVLLGSAYYYRDGAAYGAAGWVPGRRFLLPAALLACVPAARALAHYSRHLTSPAWGIAVPSAALVVFIVGFTALSLRHQQYLDAQATVQDLVRRHVPSGSCVVTNQQAFKAFAPVQGEWLLRIARGDGGLPAPAGECYRVWFGDRDVANAAPAAEDRLITRHVIRSWAWARELQIAPPSTAIAMEQHAR